MKAADALRAGARWSEQETLPAMDELHEWLLAQPVSSYRVVDGVPVEGPIDPIAAPAGAARTLEATYTRPYHMHASIGPSAALAQWTDGELTVWSHSQGVYLLRARARPGARHRGGQGPRRPRRGARLLRPQRRRRCRSRRRVVGARGPGTPGAAAVDARGRARLGTVRPGDGGEDPGEPRRSGPSARLEPRRAQQHPHGARLRLRRPLGADRRLAPSALLCRRRDRCRCSSITPAFTATPIRSTPCRSAASSSTSSRTPPCAFLPRAVSAPTPTSSPSNRSWTSSPLPPAWIRSNSDLRHLDDERARAVLRAAAERAGWEGRRKELRSRPRHRLRALQESEVLRRGGDRRAGRSRHGGDRGGARRHRRGCRADRRSRAASPINSKAA